MDVSNVPQYLDIGHGREGPAIIQRYYDNLDKLPWALNGVVLNTTRPVDNLQSADNAWNYIASDIAAYKKAIADSGNTDSEKFYKALLPFKDTAHYQANKYDVAHVAYWDSMECPEMYSHLISHK